MLAVVAGAGVSSQWNEWLLFTNAVDFGQTDPLFGKDIGFYVFTLPFLQFARGLAQGLVVLAALGTQMFVIFPILLLLLARSGYDSTDTFNLEAARYLRRNQWTATTEMLKLLAQHPEPLARTLAYTRLDPRDDAQKKILQERISAEKDQGLLKMVMGRLSVDMPIQPTAAAQTPR